MAPATIVTPERPAAPSIGDTRLFIDNTWVDPVDGSCFETLNPATGEVIASVTQGGPADVDRAVKAARRALESPPYSTMDAADRGRLLLKLADLVEAHAQGLAGLESLNSGKTINDSCGDMQGVANTLRYYGGWADKIEGRTHYRQCRRGGYPLGSGGMESSNKFICHVRLKRSGAWWYEVNSNQMLALRCAQYNGTLHQVFARHQLRQQGA